jgi:hypothetical protein
MANVDLSQSSVAYFEPPLSDEAGYYLLEGDVSEDENGTTHESVMTPGQRVYPSPEGDGFLDAPPDEDEEA